MAKRSQRVKNDPSSSGLAERICEDRTCRSDHLETGGLGRIDLESIAVALIAACHFGGGVAKVILDIGFLDLRRRGEAGPPRMAAEVNNASPVSHLTLIWTI